MRGCGIVPGPHQECCLATPRGIGFMRPLLNTATVVSMMVGLALLLSGELEKTEKFYEATKFLGIWAGGCVLIDCIMVVIGGIDYLLSNDDIYTDPIRNSMRQRSATTSGTYGYGLRRTPLESETEFVTGQRRSRRANNADGTPY